jgi:chromosome segregation ATPase
MKSNLAATILIIVCLGLGIVLWRQNVSNADQTKNLDNKINNLTNEVISLKTELSGQTGSNETIRLNLITAQLKASNDLAALSLTLRNTSNVLEKAESDATALAGNVAALKQALSTETGSNETLRITLTAARLKASNDLAASEANLSTAYANLEKAQSDAKAAAASAAAASAAASAAIAEKDKQIAELRQKNIELDKQADDLRGSITNLEAQARASQRKLDAAEGDTKILISELKWIQAQKDEMERKLNDLAALKKQVKTMETEIVVARRADWILRDLYNAIGEKGGYRLINPPQPAPIPTNVALDVEVHQGGGVKINSPGATNTLSTNTPSASPTTARAPSGR